MSNYMWLANDVAAKFNNTANFKELLLKELPKIVGCKSATFIDIDDDRLGYHNCIYYAILRLTYNSRTYIPIVFDFRARLSSIASDTIELTLSGRIIKRETIVLKTGNTAEDNRRTTDNFFEQLAELISKEINFNQHNK